MNTSIITPNNEILKSAPKQNIYSLEELQEIVGGYIEIVFLPNKFCLVVNEEGKLNNLPINSIATEIMQQHGINDIIVGNALYCNINQLD